jgi:hypothetical protein
MKVAEVLFVLVNKCLNRSHVSEWGFGEKLKEAWKKIMDKWRNGFSSFLSL